jgi:hypothetical protein
MPNFTNITPDTFEAAVPKLKEMSDVGIGIVGRSNFGPGVVGISNSDELTTPGIAGRTSPGMFPTATGDDASLPNNLLYTSAVLGIATKTVFGVSGVSVGGVGIHGSGKIAGFFEGDVNIYGALVVNQKNLVDQIASLQASVDELRLSKMTVRGQKGTVATRDEDRPKLDIIFDGLANFSFSGTGFDANSNVIVTFTFDRGGTINSYEWTYKSNPIGSLYPGNPQGVSGYVPLPLSPGDHIIAAAYDGRPDLNDSTGLLWSITVDRRA